MFGEGVPRLPNTSCVAMPGVAAETQVMALDLGGVAVSAGAACSSGKVKASHVLAAMGVARRWRATRSASASAGAALRRISSGLRRHGYRCGPGSARFAPAALHRRPEQEDTTMNDMTTTITAQRTNGARGSNEPTKPVYLDYQATTPIDPRVLEAMMPYFTEKFGNPHSRNHHYGWEAEEAVEKSRKQVADLIGADEREIVFTSGATESNNLAIAGVARFYKDRKNHIVTVATEHKCVLDSCRHLEQEGFQVTYLPVQKNGLVDLDVLRQAITPKTVLVSVMAVNNEIGVIQPLAEIGEICREKGAFFHTDAAQAFGKIPLDVDAMKIDLMSISGHKIYGPKGIGALYVRRKPRVRLVALIHGGGQERGMRSGTLPTPLCVGLGEAAAIAQREMAQDAERLTKLRDRFLRLGQQAPVGGLPQRRCWRAASRATSTSASPMSKARG